MIRKVVFFSLGILLSTVVFSAYKYKVNKEIAPIVLPVPENVPKSILKPLPSITIKTNLLLEKRNTLVLKGEVNEGSVSLLENELLAMNALLPSEEPIFLVVDSPGGEVSAGTDLITFIKGLRRPVHTVTLFAASMAFVTVQALDTRYITVSGTLMSHRASAQGIGGELSGNLDVRLAHFKRAIEYNENMCAIRMHKSLANYKDLIRDEYWVNGFDAVKEKAADEVVNVSCGKSLQGTTKTTMKLLFMEVNLEYSNCPLITGPLMIKVPTKNKDNNLKFIQNAYKHSFLKSDGSVEIIKGLK